MGRLSGYRYRDVVKRLKQSLVMGDAGGMVTTHRADLWNAMWVLKDHGKPQEEVYDREHPPSIRWLHERYRFAGLWAVGG